MKAVVACVCVCGLTTTITIVLCPSEKNRPHVTGSWPRAISALVALSIALSHAEEKEYDQQDPLSWDESFVDCIKRWDQQTRTAVP